MRLPLPARRPLPRPRRSHPRQFRRVGDSFRRLRALRGRCVSVLLLRRRRRRGALRRFLGAPLLELIEHEVVVVLHRLRLRATARELRESTTELQLNRAFRLLLPFCPRPTPRPVPGPGPGPVAGFLLVAGDGVRRGLVVRSATRVVFLAPPRVRPVRHPRGVFLRSPDDGPRRRHRRLGYHRRRRPRPRPRGARPGPRSLRREHLRATHRTRGARGGEPRTETSEMEDVPASFQRQRSLPRVSVAQWTHAHGTLLLARRLRPRVVQRR